MSKGSEQAPATPMEADAISLRRKALKDAGGHILARALHLAVQLRVADQLGNEPASAAAVAERSATNERATYRLLHFLARHGYVAEGRDKRFCLTPLGRMLREDAPDHTAAVISSLGHPGVWQAFAGLADAVRTGLPPGHRRSRNLYEAIAAQQAERRLAESMIGYHASEPAQLLSGYDFSTSRVVVDVGGSSGRLLIALLGAYPHASGIVFDTPGIESEADAAIARAGLEARCRFVGGSFFDEVPSGGDTYILSRILHDWPDEDAVAILRSCREAMREESKLLIAEPLLSPDGRNEDELPIDMLLLTNTEGRLRTSQEYAELLERAGMSLSASLACGETVTVHEAHVT